MRSLFYDNNMGKVTHSLFLNIKKTIGSVADILEKPHDLDYYSITRFYELVILTFDEEYKRELLEPIKRIRENRSTAKIYVVAKDGAIPNNIKGRFDKYGVEYIDNYSFEESDFNVLNSTLMSKPYRFKQIKKVNIMNKELIINIEGEDVCIKFKNTIDIFIVRALALSSSDFISIESILDSIDEETYLSVAKGNTKLPGVSTIESAISSVRKTIKNIIISIKIENKRGLGYSFNFSN